MVSIVPNIVNFLLLHTVHFSMKNWGLSLRSCIQQASQAWAHFVEDSLLCHCACFPHPFSRSWEACDFQRCFLNRKTEGADWVILFLPLSLLRCHSWASHFTSNQRGTMPNSSNHPNCYEANYFAKTAGGNWGAGPTLLPHHSLRWETTEGFFY